MNPYLIKIVERLAEERNASNAEPMSAYMRNQFAYLGIKSPQLSAISKWFFASSKLPDPTDLGSILNDLWNLPEREYQYFGVGLLNRMTNTLPPNSIDDIEFALTHKSWWDTVDSIATNVVGPYFNAHQQVCDQTLKLWRSSDNFWLRRTCILHQLNYKKRTNADLLYEIIGENLGSKEFFINKAIGWSLREYSKTDPHSVRNFVENTSLSPLSKREALKWLDRKAR